VILLLVRTTDQGLEIIAYHFKYSVVQILAEMG